MITGNQIRAARALIRLSAEDLASATKLGIATIRRAEAVEGDPPITAANTDAIQRALEAAGIEFVSDKRGEGVVRLRAKPRKT